MFMCPFENEKFNNIKNGRRQMYNFLKNSQILMKLSMWVHVSVPGDVTLNLYLSSWSLPKTSCMFYSLLSYFANLILDFELATISVCWFRQLCKGRINKSNIHFPNVVFSIQTCLNFNIVLRMLRWIWTFSSIIACTISCTRLIFALIF